MCSLKGYVVRSMPGTFGLWAAARARRDLVQI